MQYKWLILVLAAGILVGLVLSGCGRGAFMTVNGEKISKDEFINRLETMPVGSPARPAGLVILDQMINEKLLEQLAKEKGVYPTEEQIEKKINFAKKGGNLENELNQRGITIDDFKKELIAKQSGINIVTKGINVSDEEVRGFYNANRDTPLFTTPETVEIAAVICNSEERIRKAEKQVKQGVDFSTVALNLSEDEGSRLQNGKLGFVWQGQEGIPKNLVDTAFSTKINTNSEPFQVQLGNNPPQWFIVKPLSRQKKKVRSFNEAKDQIHESIAFAKGRQKVNLSDLLAKKRNASKITINSDRYKNVVQTAEKGKKAKKD